MANVKMPFGKHRGKRLLSVPSEYLQWLLASEETLDAELRRAVVHELDRRGESSDTPTEEPEKKKEKKPAGKPMPEAPAVSPLGQRLAGDIRMLYRSLAMKYHPDRGGSAETMQALNELHDQLQALLARTFATP